MYNKWLKFGAFLKEVLTALTFLAMYPVLFFILYHVFCDVDVSRVFAGDVTLVVLFFVNTHL